MRRNGSPATLRPTAKCATASAPGSGGRAALSDLSRQIFCLAREGRAIPPEQAGELKQRLYAAAAGLLDDPECSEFAQREVSESLLDLAWAGGDRSAASIRLGREL